MRYLVIGTAGHIDHGKTELVRALTGVDTDRLKEEKERGMTIDLGFAEFRVSEGIEAGVVDVPGHERFVRNMLAGSTGIDLVLLVIAANEGIMPQTREHLAICELLRVPRGLVVVNKIDLVEPDWLELVKSEIADFLKDTFLARSPIVPVSARTGAGITELKDEIAREAEGIRPRGETSTFRLPVDRSFTIKGFGTVVTGTIFGGRVSPGEQVVILPAGVSARVKGIETHNRKAETAVTAQRAALNLSGVEKAEIRRGDVLVHPDTLAASRLLDVSLKILAGEGRGLKNWSEVRFHAGTAEVIGKVRLLGREKIAPGEEGFAQILLKEPVVTVARDRFVVRQASPMITIGGGEILDPMPGRKHRPRDPGVTDWLQVLKDSGHSDLVLAHVRQAGLRGTEARELVARVPLHRREIQDELKKLGGEGKVASSSRGRYFPVEGIRTLADAVWKKLEDFHRSNPLAPGMIREELKGYFPEANPEALVEAVNLLKDAGKVGFDGETIRRSDQGPELSPELQGWRDRILKRLREAGPQPPEMAELIQEFKTDKGNLEKILRLLVRQGILVRVGEGLFYPAPTLKEIERKLVDYLRPGVQVEVPKFKELFGITRKWAIPLLEYFDANRVTLRVGNARKLYPKKDK